MPLLQEILTESYESQDNCTAFYIWSYPSWMYMSSMGSNVFRSEITCEQTHSIECTATEITIHSIVDLIVPLQNKPLKRKRWGKDRREGESECLEGSLWWGSTTTYYPKIIWNKFYNLSNQTYIFVSFLLSVIVSFTVSVRKNRNTSQPRYLKYHPSKHSKFYMCQTQSINQSLQKKSEHVSVCKFSAINTVLWNYGLQEEIWNTHIRQTYNQLQVLTFKVLYFWKFT